MSTELSAQGRPSAGDAGLRVHTFRGWEGVCVCQSEASCVGWSLEAAPSCVDRAASSKLESACARGQVSFSGSFFLGGHSLFILRARACVWPAGAPRAPPAPLSARHGAHQARRRGGGRRRAARGARLQRGEASSCWALGGSGGRAPLAPPRRLRRPPPPNPHPMRTCAGLEIGGAKCVPTRLRRGALLQPWVSLRRPRTRNAALRPRRARPLPPRLWGELPRGACLGG